MKKLRQKYPIWVSIVLTVLFPVLSVAASLPLLYWDGVWDQGEYLPQLVVECVILLVMLGLMCLLGMGHVLRPGGRGLGLGQCLLPMLPILLLYTYSMLGQWILSWNNPLEPPLRIVYFLLCMLAVGITEELVFRGLITRMIFEKYGRSSLGVWFSVLASSLLFGGVHLINAAAGQEVLGGVLVQMVAAAALGMCLAAIYLRTGSLWTVALLHGYMDFCALLPSGLYGLGSITDSVGAYSGAQLIMTLVYVALALFLLRPTRMKKLIGPGEEPGQGLVIETMLAVMLLAGLFSAVLVLTL